MRLLLTAAALALCGCLGSAPNNGEAVPASGFGSSKGGAGVLTAGIWDDALNFAAFESFHAEQTSRLTDFTIEEHRAARDRARHATTALDIAVVIDTTGSMGDEISWLRTEFQQLVTDTAASNPSVTVRWALVHYRDEGDVYVVEHIDFTGDVNAFQASLDALRADGGGDFPEAPDQALARAASLSWRESPDTARLVLWIADAPPHDDKVAQFSSAVRSLRARDVHVYPVASSGIDRRTEFAMRASAQFTQGRYVFLTDDSGVGGEHLEPTVPCFVVTKLNHAVLRVFASELAGTRVEADDTQIIRRVGPETCAHF